MVEKPVASHIPSRPAPVQRRGVERVQAILDAADRILAEEGYEAATLGAVGKRAGIPTASVYHYFADRNQVDAALMERHGRDIDELVATAAGESDPGSLRAVVDALIDPHLAYARKHPSVVELWHAPGRAPVLVDLEEAWGKSQAELFRRRLIERKLIADDTPRLAVEIAYEAVDRAFGIAFRNSRTGDEATIDEARRLMTAYLETYAPKRRR